MPKKIVISTNFGGFSLSKAVKQRYKAVTPTHDQHIDTHVSRDDPVLISIIESVGVERAGGGSTRLKIVEIPDDVSEWEIMDYDGTEWVAEKHRTWS
jgi:hypothetical protein